VEKTDAIHHLPLKYRLSVSCFMSEWIT